MALVVTSTVPSEFQGSRLEKHVYDNLDTLDTSPTAITVGNSRRGSIQAIGTFGSGTVRLQGSNDGTNWANLANLAGTTIGLTSAGIAEFNVHTQYLRPLMTSGTADDVDVFIVLRD